MSLPGLKRLLDQKRNPPSPATQPFTGLTILITGATSGLGLEACKKLAALNVERLIITGRTNAKGQAAKREIEESLKSTPKNSTTSPSTPEIIPLVLDMDSFSSVQDFVTTLQSRFPAIDGAILNAGLMMKKYSVSHDGWEETIQVNVLSTILLGVLLLPVLLATAAAKSRSQSSNNVYKPHLTFVSSDLANTMKPEKMRAFIASESPLEALSAPINFPPGVAGGSIQYARSKLVLEHAVRHLAASSSSAVTIQGSSMSLDGGQQHQGQGQQQQQQHPKVIINTVCPGMCKSGLGRQMKGNPIFKFFAWLFYAVFARTAEQGANSYMTALLVGDEMHGQMWKDDRIYEVGPMIVGPEGREFGDKVWNEVRQVILKADSRTKPFLP